MIDYLPLGSIVLLKNGVQKVLVISRAINVRNGENDFFFDYGGVAYPEGLIGDQMVYFNADKINKVVFKGYSDIDDENKSEKRKKLFKDGDSQELEYMLNGYLSKPPAESFRDAVIRTCLELIKNKMEPGEAVMYAVALDERNFMWDALCDYVEENVLKEEKNRA